MTETLHIKNKKFRRIDIDFIKSNGILEENSLDDITMTDLSGDGIVKVHTKAFGKAAQVIQRFWFPNAQIQHQPPEYDVWKALSSLQSPHITVGLNVTEIPSNVIQPLHQSEIYFLQLINKNPLTVRSNAFSTLTNLNEFDFTESNLMKIEKHAFKFDKSSDKQLTIAFYLSNFTGDIFEAGAFDGIQRPTEIQIYSVHLSHLDEGVFKSFLKENNQNQIRFLNVPYYGGYIDCEDCRNQWLIHFKNQAQANCKQNFEKSLFDQDIQVKLNQKCK